MKSIVSKAHKKKSKKKKNFYNEKGGGTEYLNIICFKELNRKFMKGILSHEHFVLFIEMY